MSHFREMTFAASVVIGLSVGHAVCASPSQPSRVEFRDCPKCDRRIRIDLGAGKAYVNLSRIEGMCRDEAAARAERLLDAAVIPPSRDPKIRPLMGWSSWNTFGIEISDSLILDVARAMATNGLKAAGYTYVNIDDGYFGGRDENGALRIHPVRFPNGLKPVVDRLHALGFKAGIYTDAGSDTCDSLFGGSGDKSGRGCGLYGHDAEDCHLFFNDLGFDFIKVDWCGGQALKLDEKSRYTEIARAIAETGRRDVRLNICRWLFPGTWATDIAESWRTTGDIRANWKTVKFIIDQNLYLGAYARPGHYNDMDMLEVGQLEGAVRTVFGKNGDTGLSRDEEITHFGMWCMLSSPLVLGCDVRAMPESTKALVTNPYLLAMSQNDLGLQGQVVAREGDACVLVKDAYERYGRSRYVALYNGSDGEWTFTVRADALELGGPVDAFDLVEMSDVGRFKDEVSVTVAPHASKFYRFDGERRLPRTVYEAEHAYLSGFQALRSAMEAKTAFPAADSRASGGVCVRFLGMGASNDMVWRDVKVDGDGEYDLTFDYSAPDERFVFLSIDDGAARRVAMPAAPDGFASSSVRMRLKAGLHSVRLFNAGAWMPDIDRMTVRPCDARAASVEGLKMNPLYTVPGELDMLTEHGHPQGMACSEKAIYVACSRGIVKLDWKGRVVKQCLTRAHLGDIAYADGRVYGAYAIWDRAENESPLMIGVWDEDLNPIMERHYDYQNARGFDSCTVLGDTLYTCIDHHWNGKERFHHPPHCDNTVLSVSTRDLALKSIRDMEFDYPIHYGTQTLSNDGEKLLFGNYGAWRSEGNEKGFNFSRATTDLKLIDSRRFDAYYGFDLVPKSVSGREEPVFVVVNALGGGQHGWWRDPKGNPARIRFDFYAYDKATGKMTDINDRSHGGGFPETIFIEEEHPIEITAEAWKPGAGDWPSATWGIPWDMYRDFRGYDRIAVDFVNESGESSGTPFQLYVAGAEGHVNRGLLARGDELPAFGYGRCEFRLHGWEMADGVDPSNIARLHFFFYRPKAIKLKIYRITLLPKGVSCPPPSEGFRKKILEPLEKRKAETVKRMQVGGVSKLGDGAADSGTTFVADALAPYVTRGELPGAVSILYRDGVAEVACVGYADVAAKRKITLDDVFMQCSQTKGFCGVTVAKLIEEGRLGLDDPVSRYLPEFGTLWVEEDTGTDGVRRLVRAKNVLTVRMVMNHTGGFPFEICAKQPSIKGGGWTGGAPLRATAAIAAASPLLFEPGTKVQYSNTGIDIGAAVVEVVTGMKWEDYLKNEVLDPLGMSETSFKPSDAQLRTQVEMYDCAQGAPAKHRIQNDWQQRPYNDAHIFASAGAGLWTTARDQYKFYKMLMNLGMGDNGERILKEETVRRLLATPTRPPMMDDPNYSLGLWVGSDGWFGHGGAWGTNCSVNWRKRQLQLWAVQRCGETNPWEVAKTEAADRFFRQTVSNSGVNDYTGRVK